MQTFVALIRKRKVYFVSGLLYGLFILLIIKNSGIITNNEAEKYTSAAIDIYNGDFQHVFKSYLFYSSYILFVSIFFITGNATVVIISQSILSFIAGICLKKITDQILGKSKVSYISMVVFLFTFPIQVWTATLFSDSFFISISIITLFLTLKKKSNIDLILWACLNIILIFSRPPGIFLALPNIFFLLEQVKIMKAIHARIAFSFVFIATLVCLFYVPAETKGYIRPIAAGRIIVDSIDYTVPGFTNGEKSTIGQAYNYIYTKKGAGHILYLYAKKTLSFFTLNRPYYSRSHNILLLPFYLLYPLCLLGFYFLLKSNKQNIIFLFLTSIFGLINLVSLTYNEWSYRFTITIFPFLIVLSTISIFFIFERKKTISTT